KFTNETRNGMEDSSRHDGLKFLAAVNGTVAGGGYELALACDEILMIDDRSSTVSLPEVPLLGVLPGTGGLTRLIDKRKVRRDLADVFCSTAEGVRADRAKQWRLVDHVARPQQFAEAVSQRSDALCAQSTRSGPEKGVALAPLKRTIDRDGYHYSKVDVLIDRKARTATIAVQGPAGGQPGDPGEIREAGTQWWPLAVARELDDAILMLRANELEIGTWILKTRGDPEAVLAMDATLDAHRGDWFVRETLGWLRRVLARLDVSSRTFFAIIDRGSCFAGTLMELSLAADRSYMLMLPEGHSETPRVALSVLNFGTYPMVNGLSRLATRFCGEQQAVEALRAHTGALLDAEAAQDAGLVTFAPDDIDWEEEVRIAMEER
ncbi:MAG: enoyl-CoA hydratase-related protein, partial [Burkholderiales bacterium]